MIQVQALAVEADDLGLHPHLGTELHFVQVVEVALQGEQRVAAGAAVVAVQADAIHEGVGGVAED
ncbi:hypothetical protein D3C86_2257670 [compost metagenome]